MPEVLKGAVIQLLLKKPSLDPEEVNNYQLGEGAVAFQKFLVWGPQLLWSP